MSLAAFNYRRFSVSPVEGGWAWCVRDPAGRETAHGIAPERAIAAALVLREIARATAPVSADAVEAA